MGMLRSPGLVLAIVNLAAVSAQAQDPSEDSEAKADTAKPIITRVEDAGLGWLEGSERQDLTLDPSIGWNVDFADDSCGLSRTFGTGNELVILDLRQYAPSSSFDVTVAGPSLKARKGVLTYRFAPDGEVQRSPRHMIAKFPNNHTGVVFGASLLADLDETASQDERDNVQAAREKRVATLSIETGFARRIHLRTGPLNEAMAVMNQCTHGLLDHWGLKPDSAGQWPAMAKPRNETAFTKKVQEVFPPKALGTSGIARIRLMISETGEPTSCHLQAPTENKAFKDASCRQLVRYANFEPTLNSSGQAVASYYVVKVSYIS